MFFTTIMFGIVSGVSGVAALLVYHMERKGSDYGALGLSLSVLCLMSLVGFLVPWVYTVLIVFLTAVFISAVVNYRS